MRESFGIVCVGASAGGVTALQNLLSKLAADFALPLVIVQHRGRAGGGGLCEFLRRHSPLPLDEPDDKAEIVPGRVYVAPRDYHLLVGREGFALSTESPVGFARPAIDVLFESAADVYGARAVGVILTGANRDGARGLARIKARGGYAIVQEPASAAARSMPDAALRATKVDQILPLEEIAPLLNRLGRG